MVVCRQLMMACYTKSKRESERKSAYTNGLGVHTQVKICWDKCIQCMLQSAMVMCIMCWRHGMNVSHESTYREFRGFQNYTLDEHCKEYYYNVHLLVCVHICLVLRTSPYLHVAIIVQLQPKVGAGA